MVFTNTETEKKFPTAYEIASSSVTSLFKILKGLLSSEERIDIFTNFIAHKATMRGGTKPETVAPL